MSREKFGDSITIVCQTIKPKKEVLRHSEPVPVEVQEGELDMSKKLEDISLDASIGI